MKLPKRLSFPVLIYFIGLSLVGLCLIPWLSVKLAPSHMLPQLSISYSMPGQSPRAIESSVTSKIEAMISRISGITNIKSNSNNGNGQIVLSIDKKANMDAIRFEISTAIRQLWPLLPKGVSYPEVKAWYSDSRASSPLLTYTLNAPGTPNNILQYAETHIRPQLTRLEGISSINISGATPMEWLLEYDKNKLKAINITPENIQSAISSQLGNSFVGMTTQADDMYCAVYIKPTLNGQTDLSGVAIKNINGKIFYLGELVKIVHKEQDARTHHRINGLNTINMSIYANEQVNQIQLSKQIRQKIANIQSTFPYGYKLQLSFDSSENIKKEITDVIIRSSTALLILLLFVFLIHRNWKYLTVIMLSVGANIIVSFILYYWLDIEIQIYSIAGITISLGLIIDNILIMADHLLHRNRMNIFLAILASTLTTIASLAVVFFLDEKAQLNLLDFARVLIINLSVSLLIALLLVPALLYNTHLTVSKPYVSIKRKRQTILFNQFYSRLIHHLCQHKKWCYVVLLLAFGIPTFLIPSSIEGTGTWAKTYKTVFRSDACRHIRSFVDPLLGGSLRLFMQRSSSRKIQMERNDPVLSVRANMPYGTTLEEMNSTIQKVERSILQFKGVQQFQTHIYSPQTAHISINFTQEGILQKIPQKMHDMLISQVVRIGNATWSISGIDNRFDNNVMQYGRSNYVKLTGYNYDELMYHAFQLSKRLNKHPRVQRIIIVPTSYYGAKDYEEYIFETSSEQLISQDLNISGLNSALQAMLPQQIDGGALISKENGNEVIRIRPASLQSTEIWEVKHSLQQNNENTFRIGNVATVTRQQVPRDIEKENQQYQLYVMYDFVGDGSLGHAVLQDVIQEYSGYLTMGYNIENQQYGSYDDPQKRSDFWVILLIILIIYTICCILYNSFTLPFVVIAIIPISYIGIFLSFTIFNIPLNQGGFAAFILLSGLTCNSVIYLLNDYLSFRKERSTDCIRTYIKTFNGKIIPVFLTILSTALGFIPFMFDAQGDSFWMSLSVGTICGLFFSLIGLFLYLPVMLCRSSNNRTHSSPRIQGLINKIYRYGKALFPKLLHTFVKTIH